MQHPFAQGTFHKSIIRTTRFWTPEADSSSDEDRASEKPDPGIPLPASGQGAKKGDFAAAAAPVDWRQAVPAMQPTWDAIEAFRNPQALRSQFGAIDLRNALMLALQMPRGDIDRARAEDAGCAQRTRTFQAIRTFAASARPDPSQFDKPGCAITLPRVLAMLDNVYATELGEVLIPVLTLLALRHAGYGSQHDAAVVTHHAAAFQGMASEKSECDEYAYGDLEKARAQLLASAAKSQRLYRRMVPPALLDFGGLPEAVERGLQTVAEAYRQKLTLAQKEDIIQTLETFAAVRSMPPADMAETLTLLIDWYMQGRAGATPPPLSQLIPTILAVGWSGWRDDRHQNDGVTVSNMLTAHAALPDALAAALLQHLQPLRQKLPVVELPDAADGKPPLWHALQLRLADCEGFEPDRWAWLLEASVFSLGRDLLLELRDRPDTVRRIGAELQQCTEAPVKQQRIAQAAERLEDVLRFVVTSANPQHSALRLDLFRVAGVPLPAARLPKALNQVFRRHPEFSPQDVQSLVDGFALAMRPYGYGEAQSLAIVDACRQLQQHWHAARDAGTRIVRLVNAGYEQHLERQIRERAQRLTMAGAQIYRAADAETRKNMANQVIGSLAQIYGFDRELMNKLRNDLITYLVNASVDTRRAKDQLYTNILLEAGEHFDEDHQMLRATMAVRAAIDRRLEADTQPDLREAVQQALQPLHADRVGLTDILGLLHYFWVSYLDEPPSATASEARDVLNQLKQAQCYGPDGADMVKTAAFNNAARETLARLASDRIPGFGQTYADALEAGAQDSYAQLLERMQAMLKQAWPLPEGTPGY